MPRPASPGTKERLLAAGLDRFHRHGYANTGVQEIVEAAGVPKGSFYNHFESKEALAAAAVDSYWADLRPVVAAALVGRRINGLGRVKNSFRATASGMLAGEVTDGCFLGQIGLELAGHSERVRDRVAVAMAEWTRLIATAVEQGQQDGSIRTDLRADAIARMILDSYEGALMHARISGGPRAIRDFIRVGLPALASPGGG